MREESDQEDREWITIQCFLSAPLKVIGMARKSKLFIENSKIKEVYLEKSAMIMLVVCG